MALVPTKNPPALIGYYLGVGSLIPGLGCLLGPIAVVLGIIGVVKAKGDPAAGGMGHAIAAIVLSVVVGPLIFVAIWWLFTSFVNS